MRLIEQAEAAELPKGHIPHHVAIIMDGNGRWASYRERGRTDGHRAARKPMIECITTALGLGVEWLSFFTFSTENWIRPSSEIAVLLDFATWFFDAETVVSLISSGVRVHFIGERFDPRIPSAVRARFEQLEESSVHNGTLNLVIAFNYGGRAEIVEAVRRAIRSGVAPEALDDAYLASLMSIPDMPPVDLLIRTSGEQRLSNFMLWHLAYAELVFFDTLWPDFTRGHLETAVMEFQGRRRRFGGLPRKSDV
jgi:undecaprenyl diphosphate synthase